MAEEYGWCKDLPVVDYKDEEGNEYCVFHAPQGKKGVSVEEFNEEVFKRINEVKRNNSIPIASPSGPVLRNEKELKSCNLSGIAFEGNIDFTRFNSLPPVDFSFAKFNGEVIFSGVTFSRKADFRSAEFSGGANFSKTTLKEGLFSGAIFSKEVDFSGTKFVGIANFFMANFRGATYFFRATFGAKADFTGVAFRWVNFLEATLNRDANFMGTSIEGGDFRKIIIKEKVRFEGINLKEISLIDTDLRMIDFINCMWPEKFGRYVLYDEIELLRKITKKGKDFNDKNKKVENLYRQLKQKYKEEHNEPEVSNWHYGEKEMQRKGSTWKSFSFYLLHLYWLSSGYGERPVRAGIILSLLIIVISVLFGLTGIKSITDNSSVIKINEWPADIWNFGYFKATIEYATFESKPTFIPENWFLRIAAKLLIPLQAALFALALRNRFRR